MLKQFVMGLAVVGGLSEAPPFQRSLGARAEGRRRRQCRDPARAAGPDAGRWCQNGPTQMVAGNIYEGLLRYGPKLEPQPELAESWTRQRGRQDLHLQAQEGRHLA